MTSLHKHPASKRRVRKFSLTLMQPSVGTGIVALVDIAENSIAERLAAVELEEFLTRCLDVS